MPSRRSTQSAAASSKAVATAVAVAPAAADTKPEIAHATVAPHQAPKPRLRRNGPVHVRDLQSPRVVHVLTTTMVCHLPAAFAADGRLYLCSAFNTPRGCCLGDSCPNVHAQIDAASPPPTYVAHERDATWITLADVDAAQPGTLFDARVGTLAVAAPNAKPGDDTKPVPAHKCLATAVLESARKPISHCAHFRAKGVCDLGAKCAFVHALDDLADAPSSGAKSPHMQMPAFAETTADEDDNDGDDDGCCQQQVTPTRDWTDSFAHTSMVSPQKNASSSMLLPRARHNNTRAATAAASSYSHNPYSLAYSCAPSTAASSLTTSPPTSTPTMMTRTSGPRYRHDPYSLAGTPLWA